MANLQRLQQPPLLHQAIAVAIRNYIIDNSLEPGTALPSEHELASKLGVSRNAVREAIKALSSLGVVESRRGSGLFVGNFSLEILIENLPYSLLSSVQELSDLLEIGEVLEVSIVEALLKTYTDTQVKRLQSILKVMQEKGAAGENPANETRQFRQVLLEHLENRTLVKLLDIFWLIYKRAAEKANIPELSSQVIYELHQNIFEAIQTRDTHIIKQQLAQNYISVRNHLREGQQ